jgi:hypothetical protein
MKLEGDIEEHVCSIIAISESLPRITREGDADELWRAAKESVSAWEQILQSITGAKP